MYELYPHQHEVIQHLRDGRRAGHVRQILGMATGAGKTVVASQLALNAEARGKRVLFIVHLRELIWQAVRHFEAVGLKVGILQGENTDYADTDDVVVASIQTIASRSAPSWIDIVIIDEVHVLHRTHIELMKRWDLVTFIGLSATPLRKGLADHFSNLVRGPTVRWLTENDFLVPVRAFCPGAEHITSILENIRCGTTPHGYDYNEKQLGKAMNVPELIGDIVETWKKFGENRQTLCFPVNKAHSRSIVEDFNAAGIVAVHIEDKTPDRDRRDIIAAFRAGEIRILSSVGVLSVGFDVPDASCLILARPTKSEMLDMQQKGRGIRTAPGKVDCIILDHAGNCLKHGLPVHFEIPDLNDEAHETRTRKKKESKMVACSNCGFALEPDQFTCPACGVDRPKRKNEIFNIDGELVEYGSMDEGGAPTLEEKRDVYLQLLWYAREHDYNDGWAWHKYREKFQEMAPRYWKGLPVMPASPGLLGWIKYKQIQYAKSRGR